MNKASSLPIGVVHCGWSSLTPLLESTYRMPSQLHSAAVSTPDLRNWQMTDLEDKCCKAIHAPVSGQHVI